MVVSSDRKTAIVGWYKILNEVNTSFHRVKLRGLVPDMLYRVNGGAVYGGDELIHIGLLTTDSSSGECREGQTPSCDFDSCLFVLKAE